MEISNPPSFSNILTFDNNNAGLVTITAAPVQILDSQVIPIYNGQVGFIQYGTNAGSKGGTPGDVTARLTAAAGSVNVSFVGDVNAFPTFYYSAVPAASTVRFMIGGFFKAQATGTIGFRCLASSLGSDTTIASPDMRCRLFLFP